MKRLILLRHAKSSWSDPELDDHDRPLNARGRLAAPLMGKWLAERGFAPEHVLLSTSARTRETWALAREAFDAPPEGAVEKRLYHADPATMLASLRDAPDVADTVAMIGHQPGISSFARRLARDDTPANCARGFRRWPTAAAGVIDFDVERWSALGWGEGRFHAFACPRELV